MVRTKEMGIRQRILNLRELIQDGRLLSFSLPLISNLQAQLIELETEQSNDKAKRDAFYKSINI